MNEENVCPLYSETLQSLIDIKKPEKVSIDEIIKNSQAFPKKFPVQAAKIEILHKKGESKEKLEELINSTYPVIHENLVPLLVKFLHFKRSHGSKRERELYGNIDFLGLVDRLIECRPLVYYNPGENYILKDGKTQGSGGFQQIGHSSESSNLNIQNLMTYDEMKLSSLFAISSHSFFMNNGSRHNRGLPQTNGSHETEGVIIGLVGAKLDYPGLMEFQDCIITNDQNTSNKGYGWQNTDSNSKYKMVKEWGMMWTNKSLPLHKEALSDPDCFPPISSDSLFNKMVYKARIQMIANILLTEASIRAKECDKTAYVHVVGLGLGVCQVTTLQNELYVTAFGEALKEMDSQHISDVDFSWFSTDNCCGTRSGDNLKGTKVKIHFSKRDLHDKVPSGCLLVCSIAMDNNSFPGNKYWMNMLSTSANSAAACSSCIAELHNFLINPLVTSKNLHIATNDNKIVHVSDFAKTKLTEVANESKE